MREVGCDAAVESVAAYWLASPLHPDRWQSARCHFGPTTPSCAASAVQLQPAAGLAAGVPLQVIHSLLWLQRLWWVAVWVSGWQPATAQPEPHICPPVSQGLLPLTPRPPSPPCADAFSESESPKKWAQPYSKRSHAVTSDGLRTLLLVGGEPVPLSAATSPSLSPVHSPTARSPLARSPLARALQSATGQTGSGASVGSFRHVLLPRVLPGPPGGAEQPAAQQ